MIAFDPPLTRTLESPFAVSVDSLTFVIPVGTTCATLVSVMPVASELVQSNGTSIAVSGSVRNINAAPVASVPSSRKRNAG